MWDWFCSRPYWRAPLAPGGSQAQPASSPALPVCLNSLSGQGVCEADHILAWHLEGYCQGVKITARSWQPIHRAGERSRSQKASWTRGASPGELEDVAGRQAADLGRVFLAGGPHLLDSPVMVLLRGKKVFMATVCTSHGRGEEAMEEVVAVSLETLGFMPLAPTIGNWAKRQARQAQGSCFLSSSLFILATPYLTNNKTTI